MAIKERQEAEEASVRLKVMKEDEAEYRKVLQDRRREKFQVRGEGWRF